MSNRGVQTRGKAKFGSVSAAAVIDAVVTNSVKSAVEGAISESIAAKAGVKKEKVKAGKKKQAKVSDVAGLPTSSTSDIFDLCVNQWSQYPYLTDDEIPILCKI
jgi:hypothetical protein